MFLSRLARYDVQAFLGERIFSQREQVALSKASKVLELNVATQGWVA